jgi:hypothetical protein
MKLSEWLKVPGEKRTQDRLGRAVGLTQGRISQIADKGTTDLKTALAIEAATDRQVSLAELLMADKSDAEPSGDKAGAAA